MKAPWPLRNDFESVSNQNIGKFTSKNFRCFDPKAAKFSVVFMRKGSAEVIIRAFSQSISVPKLFSFYNCCTNFCTIRTLLEEIRHYGALSRVSAACSGSEGSSSSFKIRFLSHKGAIDTPNTAVGAFLKTAKNGFSGSLREPGVWRGVCTPHLKLTTRG